MAPGENEFDTPAIIVHHGSCPLLLTQLCSATLLILTSIPAPIYNLGGEIKHKKLLTISKVIINYKLFANTPLYTTDGAVKNC